jgi:hypothetical protein
VRLVAIEAEISAGAKALRSYIESIDYFEGAFAPKAALDAGVSAVIEAADAASDQSPAGRLAAAATALRAAIDAGGYGSYVSDQQCAAGAGAVLVAVARLRTQERAKAGDANA